MKFSDASIIIYIAASIASATARESLYPSYGGVHQNLLGVDESIDITPPHPFYGLKTFANLPYVNCLAGDAEADKYDIAILGAPFDTVSTHMILPW